MSWTVSV